LDDKRQTAIARSLRRRETDAERKLWSKIRGDQLGAKFRQQPVGDYIVDFISFDRNLIIELDGSQHGEPGNAAADRKRTQYLESRGFRVLRFWDNDALQNIEGVVFSILQEMGSVD
jgi:very-short-patch-repair endonuclease